MDVEKCSKLPTLSQRERMGHPNSSQRAKGRPPAFGPLGTEWPLARGCHLSGYPTYQKSRIFPANSAITLLLAMPADVTFDPTFDHSYAVIRLVPQALPRCGNSLRSPMKKSEIGMPPDSTHPPGQREWHSGTEDWSQPQKQPGRCQITDARIEGHPDSFLEIRATSSACPINIRGRISVMR